MKDSIAAFPFTSFLSFYHQLRSRSMTWTTTDTFQTESCSRFSSSWSAAISRTRSYNRFVYIRFTTQTYIRCDDLSPPPPPRPPPPGPIFYFFGVCTSRCRLSIRPSSMPTRITMTVSPLKSFARWAFSPFLFAYRFPFYLSVSLLFFIIKNT